MVDHGKSTKRKKFHDKDKYYKRKYARRRKRREMKDRKEKEGLIDFRNGVLKSKLHQCYFFCVILTFLNYSFANYDSRQGARPPIACGIQIVTNQSSLSIAPQQN